MNCTTQRRDARGHFPRCHNKKSRYLIDICPKAENGTRTHDLLITNQLLYQLSHPSTHYTKIMLYYYI